MIITGSSAAVRSVSASAGLAGDQLVPPVVAAGGHGDGGARAAHDDHVPEGGHLRGGAASAMGFRS